jgi:hypothetical protein
MLISEDNVKCINCNYDFPLTFFVKNTPKNFYKETLLEHNTKLLFAREKNLLPTSFHLVEIEKEKDRLKDDNKNIRLEILDLNKKIAELERRYIMNKRLINNTNDINIKKKTYIHKCPINNCRGYLNNEWICGICNVKICDNCFTELNEEHKCDESLVETTKLILKISKPCPECGISIMKSEGCDHMFCTAPGCNTGFSWKTGLKIKNSENTNPYYYQWVRSNNITTIRSPGDVRCGGLPDINELWPYLCLYIDYLENLDFIRILRCTHHIQIIEIPYYRNLLSFVENNDELRVDYLLNRINEEQWKKELKIRLKNKEKYTNILNLFTLFVDTMIELINSLMIVDLLKENVINNCKSIKLFRQYINDEFVNLIEIYNNKMPFISKKWEYCTQNTKGEIKIVS